MDINTIIFAIVVCLTLILLVALVLQHKENGQVHEYENKLAYQKGYQEGYAEGYRKGNEEEGEF